MKWRINIFLEVQYPYQKKRKVKSNILSKYAYMLLLKVIKFFRDFKRKSKIEKLNIEILRFFETKKKLKWLKFQILQSLLMNPQIKKG